MKDVINNIDETMKEKYYYVLYKHTVNKLEEIKMEQIKKMGYCT
ncbi:hypothetical protein AGMMS49928_29310 [Spirochaetia bacterium]|nr:hypothetical protein AGMMS49928_29310 [Spirochaetia bacterium]